MNGQGKKVVTELVVAFVVLLLLVVLRPLFIGQVNEASNPYTIQNGTGTITVTPSTTISTSMADTVYSVVIFLVALIALIVILLSVAGKI